MAPKHRTNLFRNILNYPVLNKGDFEEAFPDMFDSIAKHYSVSLEQGKHYIAGLSSGARQAANIVKDNPDMFTVIGLFSPVVQKKQIPKTNGITYYMIYTGKNDLFCSNGKRFAKRLNKAGIKYSYFETDGSHIWRSWRIFLLNFLKNLSENPTVEIRNN